MNAESGFQIVCKESSRIFGRVLSRTAMGIGKLLKIAFLSSAVPAPPEVFLKG